MADYTIKPAWRLRDPQIEREAIAFWQRLNLLPSGVDPAARARELCAVAYDGDELIGVATSAIGTVPFLKEKLAMFRCAVAPDHRGAGTAVLLIRYAKELLERWSAEHPGERVMGLLTDLRGYKAGRTRDPVDGPSGITLIGYTPEGHQVRLVWFKHARV